ncbi:FAD binding domain-containing protein [Endozoicomonas gorgoniicola]|uniref:FAD binding domain-containing protein n=1 Tax=Endozoicomonas gorgoniicola TaxID=1234144 RepID=A0ABT3MP53_9GAMM|nr:FAD binding domain-containing protein [Endozoicomonas gorgoniicola]MCW7551153.1 FAD binding domain-containing protein [Endozoicomonas gorgoniicola]
MIKQYLRPKSLDEALAFKAKYGDDAVYIAGGARLNAAPTQNEREVAVSLSALDLKGCEKTTRGWEIGALTTLQTLVDHPELPEGLREAAALVYSRNVRNQCTLGGEIAAGLPHCLIVPALLAMDARIEITEGFGNVKVQSVAEYQNGLITKIIVPAEVYACFNQKVSKSAADLPIVNASFVVHRSHEGVESYAVALSGSSLPVSMIPVETSVSAFLTNDISRQDLEKAVSNAVSCDSDFRASAEYKQEVSGVLVASMVEAYKVKGQ